MSASERISEFVSACVLNDAPGPALDNVKAAVLDYVGVTLAGGSQLSARIVRGTVESMGARPEATVWSTGHKTSSGLAALANGTAAHALDLDDTNPLMLGHPSIQLLPALFALAEGGRHRGAQLLAAYVAGFEVGAALGRALNPPHVAQGWFPVGTLGTVMQTAACAKLLSLTVQQTQMAIGLAANLSSGLRCNSGSMAKHVLVGHAASNSVMSVLLARKGMTANPHSLEDPCGFFENFSGRETTTLDRAVGELGKRWEITESGICFKLYPCCAATHVAIDCAIDIARREPIDAENVLSIEVTIHRGVRKALHHRLPRTPTQAQFSLQYCVSRALLDGTLGVRQFHADKLSDPVLIRLMEKVQPIYADFPLVERDFRESRFPAEVALRMKDGRVLSTSAEFAKGAPKHPLSAGELEAKFFGCCAPVLSTERAAGLLGLLRSLDQVNDVAELIGAMGH